jgi:hypothetical protein
MVSSVCNLKEELGKFARANRKHTNDQSFRAVAQLLLACFCVTQRMA